MNVTFFSRKMINRIIYIFLLLFITKTFFFFKVGIVEKISSSCAYPFLLISHYVASPLKNCITTYQTYKNLYTYVQKLEGENKNLIDENIRYKALYDRTEQTKDIEQFKKRYNVQENIAKIFLKTFSLQEHSFLVNRGERDGIMPDMVALYRNHIIGKVTTVFPFYSKVILLSDPSCKVAAYAHATKAAGIVIGTQEINICSFSYVNHLDTIHEGDLVFSSGQGMVFPQGFCLGKIAHSKLHEENYSITIKPLVDFTKIEFCVLLDRSLIKNF